MKHVEPKVFLIGETRAIDSYTESYLEHIGAPDWKSDANTDADYMIEVMARSCYKSFGTELNKNLTKVRTENKDYLDNIKKVGHGSVMEHTTLNFMFCDVSRVFTHELVRHRAGTAISQESLRFVRLTELRQWLPTCITENPEAAEMFREGFEYLEKLQLKLADVLKLDEKPFSKKKELTSAMRRLAPIGLATNIGWSANIRTLRHVLEMRTAASAEEEIRIVFNQVANIVQARYNNLFCDYERKFLPDGTFEFVTKYRKV